MTTCRAIAGDKWHSLSLRSVAERNDRTDVEHRPSADERSDRGSDRSEVIDHIQPAGIVSGIDAPRLDLDLNVGADDADRADRSPLVLHTAHRQRSRGVD